jgi:hypothetical protein
VTITVESVNDSPSASDDSYSTPEDQTLAVDPPGLLGNDSDPDGDPLEASVVSDVSNGSLTLDADGSLEYVPNADFSGTDSFEYEATDDNSAADTASVTITVESVNDPPVARPDSFAADEGQALTVSAPGVLEDDTDPDEDSLRASLVSGVSSGTLTLEGDGSFEYTPDQDFAGEDAFTYEADDGRGETDQAEVTIAINARPIASDDSNQTIEGQPATTDVLANDTDPDGTPNASTVQVQTSPSNGSVSANGDGTITYAPDAGFTGTDSYAYTVEDDDGTRSNRAMVTIDVLAPIQSVEQTPKVPDSGEPLTVKVWVSEAFTPTERRLFYRKVGRQDFQSIGLEPTGQSAYEGTVPESAVTKRGLQYYVRLSDGSVTATVPEEGAEVPRYVPVRTRRMRPGVTLAPDRYHMLSVPVRLDTTSVLAQLRDDFGRIDRSEWRLLRWSPQADEYKEITTEERASGSGGGALVPGRAYWLITRSGQTQEGRPTFDVGLGRSVPAASIPIELPPGCSQVANPRPYSVAWSEVEGSGSVMSPVAYDPTTTDSLNFGVEVLEPWTGYWVCNPGGSAVQISVPPREAGVEASQMAEKSEASSKNPLFGEESMFDVRPTYALRLNARLERTGAPDLRDVQNVVGVAEAGHSEVRAEDVAEPPPISEEDLRLSIVEETSSGRPMQLAGSLRPPSSKGQTWNLKVSASGAGNEPHTVRGRLQVRGEMPQNFERRLLDRDTGRPIPVGENGTFTLRLTDKQPVRHLRLIVGTERFAEAKSESIQPERTGLRAVYPNPSRGTVSVDYHLKEAQRVEVRVYDLLGRTIKTLADGQQEAGHHTVRWNAAKVASGVYLVRLKTESMSATQRISVVH